MEAKSELQNPGPRTRAPLFPSLPDPLLPSGMRAGLAAPPPAIGCSLWVQTVGPRPSGLRPRPRPRPPGSARPRRGASRLRPRPRAARLQDWCRSRRLGHRAAAGPPPPPLSRARSPAEEAATAARSPQPAPQARRRRPPRAPQAAPW